MSHHLLILHPFLNLTRILFDQQLAHIALLKLAVGVGSRRSWDIEVLGLSNRKPMSHLPMILHPFLNLASILFDQQLAPVSYTHLRAPRDVEESRMPSSA